jgi:hypothetical protein
MRFKALCGFESTVEIATHRRQAVLGKKKIESTTEERKRDRTNYEQKG